jgi:FAD/FMN-containing dehydrogenase
MNKIATYLNEHLLGEVSSAKSLRKKFSTDTSVLSLTPEIVAFPRVTNDIRKIARFTWQLAEKGHVVAITPRGFGKDTTGAAIGKGVVIDTSVHLNNIIQIAQKDKLVHVQPGVSLETLSHTLKWLGLSLPGINRTTQSVTTVGGAISGGVLGTNGALSDAIERLEVVLANGDVIETGKVSHREVNKKLGLQTLEGEIYRKLEGILEDNAEVIERLAKDTASDTTGYKAIADIRAKDGSFNLTPLFIGSQGTLGIISEVVLKTDFYSNDNTHAVIVADSLQTARDLSERLVELEPAELSLLDGELFRRAAKNGSQFHLLGSVDQIGAVIYIRFNDFSDRAQGHKLKKLRKLLSKINTGMVDSSERDEAEFLPVADISQAVRLGANDDHVSVPLIDGAWIPSNRREEFEIALGELAAKHHLELPVTLNVLNGTYDIFPRLKLDTVSDKQKLFKLLTEYAVVVDRSGGAVVSDGAEGRLKANAAWEQLDEEVATVYEQVRQVFDPFGTLNPGVKQKNELRSLIAALRTSYESSDTLR